MKLLTLIFIFLACNIAYSQNVSESDLPSAVKEEFESSHSDAMNVEWEVEDGLYKATYEVDHNDHAILLDAAGNVVEEREEILPSDLPSDVQTTLESQFEGREIESVEKIERDGEEYYRLELKGMIFDKKTVISSDGNVIEDF